MIIIINAYTVLEVYKITYLLHVKTTLTITEGSITTNFLDVTIDYHSEHTPIRSNGFTAVREFSIEVNAVFNACAMAAGVPCSVASVGTAFNRSFSSGIM